MNDTASNAKSLPCEGAFVLQFFGNEDGIPLLFTGRVEHVMSGRVAQFRTLEELSVFVGETLEAL